MSRKKCSTIEKENETETHLTMFSNIYEGDVRYQQIAK